MKRNVKKYLEEYEKKYVGLRPKQGAKSTFYRSDFEQIAELSGSDLYIAIDKALTFGFMMGVKYEKNKK